MMNKDNDRDKIIKIKMLLDELLIEKIIETEFKPIGIIDIVNDIARKRYVPQNDITRKKGIIIHHSWTHSSLKGSNPKAYANYHVNNKGWPCIGYDYVCQPREGLVYKTAELEDKNYHSGKVNSLYYGICISGNYDDELMTEKNYELIVSAILALIKEHEGKLNEKWIPEIYGHRDFSSKSCPGNNVSIEKIKNMIKERRN